MNIQKSAGFGSCLLLALAACGSSDGGGTAGPTADQACADTASAHCARRDACTDNAWAVRNYGDLATCEARQVLGCVLSLGASGTGGTPTRVESCAAALPGVSCDDLFSGALPDVCLPATGTLAEGLACAFSAQCQTTFCKVAPGALCGTCGAVPKEGDPCADAADCGARGLACSGTLQTCYTPGASGGACGKDHPCGHALSCVGATATVDGTCDVAATTAGTTCDPNRKTAPDCDASSGLGCDAATLKCIAATYVANGQACDNKLLQCPGGGRCVFASGAATGTCHIAATEGEPCDTSAGPPCLSPARCVWADAAGTAGTCRLPDPVSCGTPLSAGE